MAAKNKRRGASAEHRIGVIERELQKGQIKQALKDVKVLYREGPSKELRVLFARVSVARAKELIRQGLRPQAQDVVEELLSLGETEGALRSELASVLVALGMVREQARLVEGLDDPQAKAAALAAAADTAVLHSAGDAALPAEARGDAAAVRRAIDLIEEGRDDEALAAVRDLPRQSLLADWKLFLRGLAAWRGRDAENAAANWRRLLPGRLPARCAALLSQPVDAPNANADADELALAAQEILAGGLRRQALLDLTRLKAALASGELDQAFAIAGKARAAWTQIDPAIPVRVEALLYDAGVQSAHPDVVAAMSRSLAPPPLDPRWNRAHALASERARWAHPDIPDGYWQDYLSDLAALPALSPPERALAQALVLVHRGEFLADESEGPHELATRPRARRGRLTHIQERAVGCFAKARELAPDLLDAYAAEVQAYREWEMPGRAAEAAQKLLDRFPEHFESLVYLARRLRERDPVRSRDLARRAHRLRPLDRDVTAVLAEAYESAVRHFAVAGQFDLARQELDALDRLIDADAGRAVQWVRRGLLETKAGNPADAARWFDRLAEHWGESLPMSLARSIEARRFQLAPRDCERFSAEWRAMAQASNFSGRGLGLACDVLAAYLRSDCDYPGRADDVASLTAAYLRHQKKRFTAEDLRRIAGFLECVRDGRQAYERLVMRAKRKHPQDAYFLSKAAELEIARAGERGFRPTKAMAALEAAAKAAEASADPDDRGLAQTIRARLRALQEFLERPLPSFDFDPELFRRAVERMLAGQAAGDPDDDEE